MGKASQSQASRWLEENGPRELELLFRAIVYHPAAPILVTDNDRKYRDASAGAGKLLGLPRNKLIGCRMDDFAAPSFKPKISQLWRTFLDRGEQEGTLQLVSPDGNVRDVEYMAKGNVLPVRHVFVLRDKTARAETGQAEKGSSPPWVRDYALFLLDADGRVAAWYSGAARIYGYSEDEVLGKDLTFLYPSEDTLSFQLREELKRAAAEGHFGNEAWHAKKDGARFWANVITMALTNCAAIPTGLLESELFGYERGAFTGALAQKIGRFERAHQGTLFLDEVGDIPLDLQPKLLRALQEKSFERLGGTRTIPIDVRLVAATNRNLTQMMGDKLFRSDLYYRLKVFPITTPRLRDHPADIPILVRHFTKKYADKMNKRIDKVPSEAMQALVSWAWPGNVRELENFIERSVILSQGPVLRAPLAELRAEAVEGAGGTLAEMEREYIIRVLRESNSVISAAANRLGVPRTTLNAMMRKLGIARKDY